MRLANYNQLKKLLRDQLKTQMMQFEWQNDSKEYRNLDLLR